MVTHCCHCLLGMLIENQQFESQNSFLVLRNYILVVKNLLRALHVMLHFQLVVRALLDL